MLKNLSQSLQLSLPSGFAIGGPLDQILPPEILDSEVIYKRTLETLGSDRHWMMEALIESLKGVGITNPNPAVGCVIVDSLGNEVARGATQAYRGAHAERVAFDKIKNKDLLIGATVYVTLEPCSHLGNQSPCVELLVHSPIQRVVIARRDPFPLVNGKGITKLLQAGKQVDVGVLFNEVSAWNLSFFAQQELKRPVCILKWAQTLDGQLADDSQNSKWISGAASRSYTHWLRQRYDAILVGAKTILSDFPQLNVRNTIPAQVRNPFPIIWDPKGALFNLTAEDQSRLRKTTFLNGRKCMVITSREAVKKQNSSWIFQEENISVQIQQGVEWIPELIELLSSSETLKLMGRPIQSIFIEGGPQTLCHFLSAGYADILHVFVAPKISGGFQNRIFTQRLLRNSHSFDLIACPRLGPDSVMEMVSSKIRPVFKMVQNVPD